MESRKRWIKSIIRAFKLIYFAESVQVLKFDFNPSVENWIFHQTKKNSFIMSKPE